MVATRTFTPPTRTRVSGFPPGPVLHLIGDTHFGRVTMTPTRKRIWADDLSRIRTPTSQLAHVIVGDVTDNAFAAEDVEAVDFFNTYLGAGTWRAAVGNHDMWNNGRPSPEQAAAAWGMPAANYVYDLGDFRVIVIAPDGILGDSTSNIPLTSDRINWISAQLLAAGTVPCLLIFHWALYNTVGVGESSATQYRSIDTAFYATVDADIRAMLADHPNAKAWISGHTHSPIEAAGLVTPVAAGGHTLAAVNCSAIAYTGKVATDPTSPIFSLYAQLVGGRLDLYFRDHAAGVWGAAGPLRLRKWSVTL